jgi:hypothetical protein
MDHKALSREVDRNYDFFQRHIAAYLPEQTGRYALLRDQKVIGFYDDPGEAAAEGAKRFKDNIFSIQEVSTAPIDLGLYSYAAN